MTSKKEISIQYLLNKKKHTININLSDWKWITSFISDLHFTFLDIPVPASLVTITLTDLSKIEYCGCCLDDERKKCIILSCIAKFNVTFRKPIEKYDRSNIDYGRINDFFQNCSEFVSKQSLEIKLAFNHLKTCDPELVEIITDSWPSIPLDKSLARSIT